MAHQTDSFYIETSLPAGMTIAEYRRGRPPRPSFWQRIKALAGGAGMTPAAARQ